MSFLYFLGLLFLGCAVLFFGLRLAGGFKTGPEIPVVLLSAASGQAEANIWRAALSAAGVWRRIQNFGDFGWYGTNRYAYEVWVHAKEMENARAVLGLP